MHSSRREMHTAIAGRTCWAAPSQTGRLLAFWLAAAAPKPRHHLTKGNLGPRPRWHHHRHRPAAQLLVQVAGTRPCGPLSSGISGTPANNRRPAGTCRTRAFPLLSLLLVCGSARTRRHAPLCRRRATQSQSRHRLGWTTPCGTRGAGPVASSDASPRPVAMRVSLSRQRGGHVPRRPARRISRP